MFNIISYFIIYSILGWFSEVGYSLFKKKKFINRGFLYGPLCPIYGVGVVSIHLMVSFIPNVYTNLDFKNLFLVFSIITISTTILEYITGSVLESIFHTHWWDYSDMPFNLKGHICLRFSIIWGIGGSFILFTLHKQIISFVSSIPTESLNTFVNTFLIYFTIDCALTLKALVDFKKLISELEKASIELKSNGEKLFKYIDLSQLKEKRPHLQNLKLKLQKRQQISEFFSKVDELKSLISSLNSKYEIEDVFKKINSISKRISSNRFTKAFPDMTFQFDFKKFIDNYKNKKSE